MRAKKRPDYKFLDNGTVLVPVRFTKHPTGWLWATIDQEDFEKVSQYNWCVSGYSKTLYAKGSLKEILLHRLILASDPAKLVDHKDRNGLNCTRENLRSCNRSQNGMNREPSGKRNKYSRFKGVSWNYINQNWVVTVGKKRFKGVFISEILAAQAYDKFAIEKWQDRRSPTESIMH